MEIQLINLDTKISELEVNVNHGQETVTFNIRKIGRKAFEKFDVFHQINQLFKSFPYDKQTQMFEYYKQVRMIFNETKTQQQLTFNLEEILVEFLKLVSIQQISEWITTKSDIHISSQDFEVSYADSIDDNKNRDQTYIRKEYIDLISLSLVMRMLLPILGEYIGVNGTESGNRFKEYNSLNLLQHSHIFISDPMEKLRLYIMMNVCKNKLHPSTIEKGVGSDIFPEYVLGLILMRRISIGDIRGVIPRANLVTYIHKFMMSMIPGNESEAASPDMIKDKEKTGGGPGDSDSSDGDECPVLEKYNCRRAMTVGEIAELEFSVNNIESIAMQLCPIINMDDVYRTIETSKELINYPVLEPQIDLARWVMSRVLSPKALLYFNKSNVVKYLGLVQAVLWAKDHRYLALLATSHVSQSGEGVHESGIDTRGRIPKELTDVLDKLYPYQRNPNTKQSITNGGNYAIQSISKMVSSLSSRSWSMTADMDLISEVFSSNQSRRIPITHDIKTILAKYVIDLGARQ